MTNDVEKRWDRPATFRAAATYVCVIVSLAALAFAVYAVISKTSVVSASSIPTILFLGGVGAFVKTYQVWKVEGAWPAWQGAGWFLLIAMLVSLSIPGAAMMAT
jgi:hypothetical protein